MNLKAWTFPIKTHHITNNDHYPRLWMESVIRSARLTKDKVRRQGGKEGDSRREGKSRWDKPLNSCNVEGGGQKIEKLANFWHAALDGHTILSETLRKGRERERQGMREEKRTM